MPIDASKPYDDNNIFARILRGELPCKKVYEDEHVLAFHDINPLSPTHILVIPKGPYVSWDDFSAEGSDAEITAFVRAVGGIAREAGLIADGYRLLANTGLNSGQEVPHLHLHIFAGRPLGPMLAR
jgi:diadenosine tetraphosphate (Ap4A) HIT family hydrolase